MSCGSGCDENKGGIDFSSLPLLAGCPGDNEILMVSGAVGGAGAGKFARRRYKDIKDCIAAGAITFVPLKFTIGEVGSPMVAGETALIITVSDAIVDSEFVVLDNTYIEPGETDTISYTSSFSTSEIIITFNQSVQNGQKYYIKYAKR